MDELVLAPFTKPIQCVLRIHHKSKEKKSPPPSNTVIEVDQSSTKNKSVPYLFPQIWLPNFLFIYSSALLVPAFKGGRISQPQSLNKLNDNGPGVSLYLLHEDTGHP